MKKIKQKKLERLEQRILNIKKLQHEINKLLTEEMARKIKLAKQQNFELANKTHKWLAYTLQKERSKNIIYTLRDDKLREYSDKKNVEAIVTKVYSPLYTSSNLERKQIKEYPE